MARHWHTRDRVAHRGEPCRWEGEALEWIIDEIEAAGKGKFAPTNYNNRSRVEIKMPGSDTPVVLPCPHRAGPGCSTRHSACPLALFSAAEVRGWSRSGRSMNATSCRSTGRTRA